MFNIFKPKKDKKIFKVKGMHCVSCSMIIESELEDAGFNAKCSYAKQIVEIEDNQNLDVEQIKKAVKKAGYEIAPL